MTHYSRAVARNTCTLGLGALTVLLSAPTPAQEVVVGTEQIGSGSVLCTQAVTPSSGGTFDCQSGKYGAAVGAGVMW